jgi:D-aminopeptidase
MAKRCALGLALTGSYASDGSGEIMVAFSTAHREPRVSAEPRTVVSVANDHMHQLFEGAVDATAESVVNALCAAHTTVGRDGDIAYALPLDRLVEIMRRHGREARLPDGA